MPHVHTADVCDDDGWDAHEIRFLNHQTTPVTVEPMPGERFPFVPAGGFTVPAGGHVDVHFVPHIPPNTYSYNVVGCPRLGKKTPRTVIIS